MMRDLSMHVLDIAQNSIKAQATLVTVSFEWQNTLLSITVEDNGCGMSEAFLKKAMDPFTTTRTTRKVGLGLPMFEQSAQMSQGSFHIQSSVGNGTTVCAVFNTQNIDCLPMGNMCDTLFTLVVLNPQAPDFLFTANRNNQHATFDTRQVRSALGSDVPFTQEEVMAWIRESINEEFQPILEVY